MANWTLPHFDADLRTELKAGMAEHRAEVEAVAEGPWPPTFTDTVEALERAGQRLELAERLLDDTSWARSTPEVAALEAELRPRLAAHHDAVGLDSRIFARIADLVARRDALGLDAEQVCVLDRYHRDLVRTGATLGATEQQRLRQINERLSVLTAQFRRNLHEETAALAVRVKTAAELDGLPQSMIDAAARAAEGDGFLLKLSLPAAQPALDHLHDRALRERLWRASVARGRRGGEHDNRATVTEIVALRAERAGLLGFASHAEYALAEQTAQSVEAVIDLTTTVGAAAAAAARAEAERHTAALHADGHRGPLEPWDWPYYAARERRARHAVDEGRLQQYFELDRVIDDGLFGIAATLYGLAFVRRDDLPRPHPDVRVWAVTDADGGDRGLLYVDPFARDGKGGGAWMDWYAEPAPLLGRRPVVTLTLNAQRPADGAPALLTPLDVRILFHEFGHGLHMLLSDVTYPKVGGINVAHDVVEFPSKIHESMAVRPDVLARCARHHATGEPLSDADVAALIAAERDGAAATSTRAAANTLLDQAWHGLAPGETVAPEDVDTFEVAVLQRHGLDIPAVGLHYHSTFFTHIFDGPYPGTNYAYLWSATLEVITLQWLDENGGLTRTNGERLRDAFLSRGASSIRSPLSASSPGESRQSSRCSGGGAWPDRSVRRSEGKVQLGGRQLLGPAPGQDRRAPGGEEHHPAVVVEEDGTLAPVRIHHQIGEGGHRVGLDVGCAERVRLSHARRIGTNLPRLERSSRDQPVWNSGVYIPFVLSMRRQAAQSCEKRSR
jgi:peptidyl-dipeptidase Dcp